MGYILSRSVEQHCVFIKYNSTVTCIELNEVQNNGVQVPEYPPYLWPGTNYKKVDLIPGQSRWGVMAIFVLLFVPG